MMATVRVSTIAAAAGPTSPSWSLAATRMLRVPGVVKTCPTVVPTAGPLTVSTSLPLPSQSIV